MVQRHEVTTNFNTKSDPSKRRPLQRNAAKPGRLTLSELLQSFDTYIAAYGYSELSLQTQVSKYCDKYPRISHHKEKIFEVLSKRDSTKQE